MTYYDPEGLPDRPWTERYEHQPAAPLTNTYSQVSRPVPPVSGDLYEFVVRTNHDHVAYVRRAQHLRDLQS